MTEDQAIAAEPIMQRIVPLKKISEQIQRAVDNKWPIETLKFRDPDTGEILDMTALGALDADNATELFNNLLLKAQPLFEERLVKAREELKAI